MLPWCAEGLLRILEEEEVRHREAGGRNERKQEAAAEKAHKAAKASRDKRTGRREAEDALHEGTGTTACTCVSLTAACRFKMEQLAHAFPSC